MQIKEIDYTKLERCGKGYEGRVFKYGNDAIKIFRSKIFESSWKFESKINKLEYLNYYKPNNICYPKYFVSNKHHIIGYGMDLIPTKENLESLENIFEDKSTTFENKISLAIEAYDIVLNSNYYGFFIIDSNFRNFLYNEKSKNLTAIDSDSIATPFHKCEFPPIFFHNYYKDKFNNSINGDYTRYVIALQILSNLFNTTIDRDNLILYDKTDDYLEEVIEKLNFSKEIIEELQLFFQDNKSSIDFKDILLNIKKEKVLTKK